MAKDNSVLREKIALRRAMLERVDAPVVVETHGGLGKVFEACYSGLEGGVVFEKKPERAALLARQRPTWAVYQADCVAALAAGAGAHLEANVLDVDPHGDPWPTITAFFGSERPWATRLCIVVNDGLRNKARLGGAWSASSLSQVVRHYGNDIFAVYLEVCREMLVAQAARVGYALAAWAGYYCGFRQNVTHYLAVLERD